MARVFLHATDPRRMGPPGQLQVGGGGGAEEVARHEGATATGMRLYVEGQQRGWCGAHALNAMLGGRVTNGGAMVRYLRRRWPQGEHMGHYNADGWFSLTALNYWLYEHTPVGMHVSLYSISWQLGSNITGAVLRRTLEAKNCWGTLANINQLHWVAIVRSPEDHGWYLADSMRCGREGHVYPMDEDDWDTAAERRWNFNILTPIDAASSVRFSLYGGTSTPLPPNWMAVSAARVAEAIRTHTQPSRRCPSHDAERTGQLRAARQLPAPQPRARTLPPTQQEPVKRPPLALTPDGKGTERAPKRTAKILLAPPPPEAPRARRAPPAAPARGKAIKLSGHARAAMQPIQKFFPAQKRSMAPRDPTNTPAAPPTEHSKPPPPPDAPLAPPPPRIRAQKPPPSAPAARSQIGDRTAEGHR